MAEKIILVLGSGYVAGPCVEYLLRNENNTIVIASYHLENSQKLSQRFKSSRVRSAQVNVEDEASLDNLVSKCDLVVSLIPYTQHVRVIESALRFKKNVVTTSYINPGMAALHDKCIEAGITVMNEIGLDPGVDHVYALKAIYEAKARGEIVESFESYCGGLPAPEASNNPLGYKFSWSSRGVLLALRNDARYLEDGKIVDIPGKELMRSVKSIPIYPAFNIVGYANRDSSFYNKRYDIMEAKTVVRGSLRYAIFPPFIQALVDLGFLNDTKVDYLTDESPEISWRSILINLLQLSSDVDDRTLEATILSHPSVQYHTTDIQTQILNGIRWLGFFDSKPIVKRASNLLDTLCHTLEQKMAYQPHERDMVLLQHRFKLRGQNGQVRTLTSTLLEYGTPYGDSAMARTVGVPCGIAIQLILDGKLTRAGVLAPIDQELVNLFLPYLEKENIICVEEWV